jgi:hypothetical protein
MLNRFLAGVSKIKFINMNEKPIQSTQLVLQVLILLHT